jgi:hypothetical protein
VIYLQKTRRGQRRRGRRDGRNRDRRGGINGCGRSWSGEEVVGGSRGGRGGMVEKELMIHT